MQKHNRTYFFKSKTSLECLWKHEVSPRIKLIAPSSDLRGCVGDDETTSQSVAKM